MELWFLHEISYLCWQEISSKDPREGSQESQERKLLTTKLRDSSLNVSQKLLVVDVLKLDKLISIVPATNAVSEKSCSTLHKFKFYLRSSITQELLSSCLIIATCKEKVDEVKLKQQTSFVSKMNITFPFKNKYFSRKFTESASTRGDPNIRCSSVETQTC